jgi:hypothetical protein
LERLLLFKVNGNNGSYASLEDWNKGLNKKLYISSDLIIFLIKKYKKAGF